ncbi:MAG: phosphate acyltransferase PlsX [bacterium]|nr:phosphate acyltransferase PlsX [Planctomycetota bacterium]HIL51772.1 phosphate acyltransferase PlsX [Planctomycetota bacterium]
MNKERLALDVMGGDNAPRAILGGAMLAVQDSFHTPMAPERIILVGDEEQLTALLEEAGGNPGFEVQHASEVVEMCDPPTAPLRGKTDSSIAVAVKAVATGDAGAVISMGNTGALVASATRLMGTLAGVKRPGIAVTFDLDKKPLTVLDMGANTAPKPDHLVQYALMGSIYAREGLGCEVPRVALLNIGEESSKGPELLREAHASMGTVPIDFVGNIEGNALFDGQADVVVSDGFTGNVVLKLLEGFSSFLLGLCQKELQQHGVDWAPEALTNMKQRIDYSEYGGALLLGVQGVVVVGHGRSDERAVANALVLAARQLDLGVNESIVKGIAQAGAAPGA